MRPLMIAALASAGMLLSACETAPRVVSTEPTYEQAQNSAFNQANYNAVAELLKRLPSPNGPASTSNASDSSVAAPFVVATLVNIDRPGAILHPRPPDLRTGRLAHDPARLQRAGAEGAQRGAHEGATRASCC